MKIEVMKDEGEIEITTDEEEIEEIIDWKKKLKFRGFKLFNTPWAKGSNGERDYTNLALFIEFSNTGGDKYYWLISEIELNELNKIFKRVQSYNLTHDNQARKFHKKEEGEP